jgi:hypothetical protein
MAPPGTELFVRHAKRGDRSVALMRAVDYGDTCVVEVEVRSITGSTPTAVRPGPYVFDDVRGAVSFVTEAVETFMVLGCDVLAQ